MKKYRLLLMMLALLISLAGCSANGQNSIQWDASAVKYNANGINQFGFNINVLTTQIDPKLELISLSGENTDGLSAEIRNDSYKELKEKKYRGKYLNLIGLSCETPNDYVKIDSMTIKVDGQELVITFPNPVIHRVDEKTIASEQLQFLSAPSFVMTNSYQDTEITYVFAAEQEVTVTGFQFNHFLKLENARLLVNGIEKGALKNQFPLKLQTGQQVEIKGFLAFDDQLEYSDYDSIYCNAVVSYTPKDGGEQKLEAKLVSQSVSNIEDATAVIDRILS